MYWFFVEIFCFLFTTTKTKLLSQIFGVGYGSSTNSLKSDKCILFVHSIILYLKSYSLLLSWLICLFLLLLLMLFFYLPLPFLPVYQSLYSKHDQIISSDSPSSFSSIGATPIFKQIPLFQFLSFHVFPLIHLNILISTILILWICYFLTARHSVRKSQNISFLKLCNLCLAK